MSDQNRSYERIAIELEFDEILVNNEPEEQKSRRKTGASGLSSRRKTGDGFHKFQWIGAKNSSN